MTFLTRYRKSIVAATGAVIVIAGRLAGVDSDLYFILVTVGTSAGVYAVPNA